MWGNQNALTLLVEVKFGTITTDKAVALFTKAT